MSPLLAAAALARKAHRHLSTARELEARWAALAPEHQDAVRAELGAMRQAAQDVRFKLSYGARGFAQEFRAARDGVEPGQIAEGKPLSESVKELGRATRSVTVALQAADPPVEAEATARPPRPS